MKKTTLLIAVVLVVLSCISFAIAEEEEESFEDEYNKILSDTDKRPLTININPQVTININWNEKPTESVVEAANEIVELKPNFFGLGINLNKVITKIIVNIGKYNHFASFSNIKDNVRKYKANLVIAFSCSILVICTPGKNIVKLLSLNSIVGSSNQNVFLFFSNDIYTYN